MNKDSAEVNLSAAVLGEAQACENLHVRSRHETPIKLNPSYRGRKHARIERKQVWDFVQAHRCEDRP